jgi:hypothetical protein
MVSCNSTIHATCSLTFMAYKYYELQVSSTTQKLSCKAGCKTPFLLIVLWDGFEHFQNYFHPKDSSEWIFLVNSASISYC